MQHHHSLEPVCPMTFSPTTPTLPHKDFFYSSASACVLDPSPLLATPFCSPLQALPMFPLTSFSALLSLFSSCPSLAPSPNPS